MADKFVLILIACPVFLIPLFAALTLAWGLWAFLSVIFDRIRGPKVIYTPKKDSPELIEAMRTGYTPRLGLELNEIFPEAFARSDIERLLAARAKLFPDKLSEFFYSTDTQDLSPKEFKALALRLFLEMAFMRAFILENSPRLWPQKSEDLWAYHAPKALRKLYPDYFRQLLNEFKNTDHASTRKPVAA